MRRAWFLILLLTAVVACQATQDDTTTTIVDSVAEESTAGDSAEIASSPTDTPTQVAPTDTPAPTADPNAELLQIASELPVLGVAPDITNDQWLNTDESMTLEGQRGKVVLIEFWTFG